MGPAHSCAAPGREQRGTPIPPASAGGHKPACRQAGLRPLSGPGLRYRVVPAIVR